MHVIHLLVYNSPHPSLLVAFDVALCDQEIKALASQGLEGGDVTRSRLSLSCLVKDETPLLPFCSPQIISCPLRISMNSPVTDNDRIAAARHEAEILKEKLKRKQDALNDGHCELTFPGVVCG